MPSIGSICKRNELLREELGGGFLPEIRAGNLSELFNGLSFWKHIEGNILTMRATSPNTNWYCVRFTSLVHSDFISPPPLLCLRCVCVFVCLFDSVLGVYEDWQLQSEHNVLLATYLCSLRTYPLRQKPATFRSVCSKLFSATFSSHSGYSQCILYGNCFTLPAQHWQLWRGTWHMFKCAW